MILGRLVFPGRWIRAVCRCPRFPSPVSHDWTCRSMCTCTSRTICSSCARGRFVFGCSESGRASFPPPLRVFRIIMNEQKRKERKNCTMQSSARLRSSPCELRAPDDPLLSWSCYRMTFSSHASVAHSFGRSTTEAESWITLSLAPWSSTPFFRILCSNEGRSERTIRFPVDYIRTRQ